MARLSERDKEHLVADFHTGQYTQRELARKYDVSTATVNKLTKGKDPESEHIVNAVSSHLAQLEGKSEQEVNAVFSAIDSKTRHIQLIMSNVEKLANKLSMMADQIDEAQDLRHLVEANDKLSLTAGVNQRHAPKTDITQVQGQSQQTIVEIVEDKRA